MWTVFMFWCEMFMLLQVLNLKCEHCIWFKVVVYVIMNVGVYVTESGCLCYWQWVFLPMLLFTLKFGCEMQGRKIIQPDKIVNHLIPIKLKISNLKTVKSQTQNLKSQNFKIPNFKTLKSQCPDLMNVLKKLFLPLGYSVMFAIKFLNQDWKSWQSGVMGWISMVLKK